MTLRYDDYWDVTLECDHVLFYQTKHLPDTSEVLWCRSCESYKTISDINGPYKFLCTNCNRSRSFGLERVRCEVMAQAHANKAGHTVESYKVGKRAKTKRTWSPQTEALTGIPF